ncbi:MAG TPA: helix-turn-helix transcriptional regulator [Methylomirabilota bacterium]|nr:helix-turn-helix transcriptional regulator [Methylomirabilota bacterium]
MNSSSIEPVAVAGYGLRLMSQGYFAAALKSLMERYDLKQADIARKTGLSAPQISRYISGVQKYISPEDMNALVRAMTIDPLEQAELVRAHLLDECCGPGSDMIDIVIRNAPKKAAGEVEIPWTAEGRKALSALIKASADNPSIERIFVDLASGMGLIP